MNRMAKKILAETILHHLIFGLGENKIKKYSSPKFMWNIKLIFVNAKSTNE